MLPFPHHIQINRRHVVVDVRLNPTANPSVTVRLGKKIIWHDIPREWHPWKLAAMDVDNDGADEFIVALNKHTRHSPYRLHTLFVYGFDGEHIYPKWRGSSMGRDFTDFAVINSDTGQRVLTLDRLLNGTYVVSCHAWSGFGFEKIWQRGGWHKASLQTSGTHIRILTESGPKLYDSNGVSSKNL